MKDGTTDEDRIRTWWKEWPSANVGIVTGAVSGLVVVDIDGPEGERELTASLNLPETLTSLTGNGRHLFFLYPDGEEVGSPVSVLPGIDVRGDRTYVVAPPSHHVSGGTYAWDNEQPDTPARMPAALLELLVGTEEKQPIEEVLARGVPKGARNVTLTRYVGHLLAVGVTGSELHETCVEANAKYFNPPLDEDEVIGIVESIEARDEKKRREGEGRKGESKRPTETQKLVQSVKDIELFHTPEGEAFATFEVEDHHETWPIRSSGFVRWLRHRFWTAEKKPPAAQVIRDAVATFEARAHFQGEQQAVFVRVGSVGETIYLDLANAAWEAIEITARGWRLVSEPPVRFRRAPGMLPLPRPEPGRGITLLRDFVNVGSDADFILLCVWLVAALRPIGPYLILVVYGEQGSAKSSLARVVRSLVDPSTVALRSLHREERDLMITARNSWVIAFDNVSKISDTLSDALCRVATGGGFSTRQLYSDTDEVLFDAQRPIILNGIDEFVTRDDLRDRSLVLVLPRMPDEKRRDEQTFWREFKAARPGILAGLLDAVVAALERLPNVRISHLPRMADFARWAVAAEPGLGFRRGVFLKAYDANQRAAAEAVLEADPVGEAVRRFAEQRREWTGTASDLLEVLAGLAPGILTPSRWPPTPAHFSGDLRRLTAALREVGIDLAFTRSKDRTRRRLITIRRGR